jgi:hypothetical protein
MADIKITKAAVKPVAGASPGAKAQPSAFDVIRSKIAGKVAADLQVPPPVQPNAQQVASIEGGLKTKLERTDARNAADFFRVEMKDSKVALDKLTQAVDKLPQKTAFGPVRQRLNLIEQQYQKSGELIGRVKNMDPQSLLKAQVQLYQLSENMELLSKVVEQMTTGVKTIMQTNV